MHAVSDVKLKEEEEFHRSSPSPSSRYARRTNSDCIVTTIHVRDRVVGGGGALSSGEEPLGGETRRTRFFEAWGEEGGRHTVVGLILPPPGKRCAESGARYRQGTKKSGDGKSVLCTGEKTTQGRRREDDFAGVSSSLEPHTPSLLIPSHQEYVESNPFFIRWLEEGVGVGKPWR